MKTWHPDKNDDPEAENIFMDIVEAYEVLMEDDLRDKYDRGEDVSGMAQKKRTKAFDGKFHYNPSDVKDDKVKAWYVDPETGEKEFVDLNLKKENSEGEEAFVHLPRHCCIGE